MRLLPKFFVTFLLLLLQACASAQTVTFTQLSNVKDGADREEVEAILGAPADQEVTSENHLAFYEYNYEILRSRGKNLPKDLSGCVGSCAMGMLILIPLMIAEDEFADPLVSVKKRGALTIVYDQFSRVASIHPNKNLVKEFRYRQKLKTEAEIGSAKAQYELFTLLTDKKERLVWLCRSSHNGYPKSQIQLARHYWYGIEPFAEDRAIAFMWYSLAAGLGSERGRIEIAERKGLLTENQTLRAEMLLKNWTANPKSCQSTFSQAIN